MTITTTNVTEGAKERMGDLLKDLRNARGWSLSDLRARTDIHTSSLERYEAGTRMPQLENLHKLATAFGFKSSDLLSEIGL